MLHSASLWCHVLLTFYPCCLVLLYAHLKKQYPPADFTDWLQQRVPGTMNSSRNFQWDSCCSFQTGWSGAWIYWGRSGVNALQQGWSEITGANLELQSTKMDLMAEPIGSRVQPVFTGLNMNLGSTGST